MFGWMDGMSQHDRILPLRNSAFYPFDRGKKQTRKYDAYRAEFYKLFYLDAWPSHCSVMAEANGMVDLCLQLTTLV